MLRILKKNKEITVNFILFTFIITVLLLLTVVFKNNEEIISKEKNVSIQHQDLSSIKEFLLTKIKSPFINIDYEIKSGDSIQKILKKFKVHNNEIQAVINQYKKYSNPNQLLMSNKIDLIIEENLYEKNYSIAKFAIPISKSTTIEIIFFFKQKTAYEISL